GKDIYAEYPGLFNPDSGDIYRYIYDTYGTRGLLWQGTAEVGSISAVLAGIFGVEALLPARVILTLSKEEVAGLRELFGKGPSGARALLDKLAEGSVDLPQGVTQQTLQTYAQIAQNAINRGIDKIGTQALRLQAIREILK